MPRLPHNNVPPKFCVSCGDDFALPHHRLCRACLASLNLNIARQRKLHTDQKRIQAQSQRSAKAERNRQRSAKAERDRQRSNPANFSASNKAIAHQIKLLDAAGLLPDPRRQDYDEVMHSRAIKNRGAPRRPRMPVQAATPAR